MLPASRCTFVAVSDEGTEHTFHLLFKPDEIRPDMGAAFLVFNHPHHERHICTSDFFSLTVRRVGAVFEVDTQVNNPVMNKEGWSYHMGIGRTLLPLAPQFLQADLISSGNPSDSAHGLWLELEELGKAVRRGNRFVCPYAG